MVLSLVSCLLSLSPEVAHAALQCEAFRTACTNSLGDFCRDTQTDINNCGSCGSVCGANQMCEDGGCQALGLIQVNGNNGFKCSTSKNSALIKYHYRGYCPNGQCTFTLPQIGLNAQCGLPGSSVVTYYSDASAYMASFFVSSKTDGAFQQQQFDIGISKQKITGTSKKALYVTMNFTSLARSAPALVVHDGDYVAIDFEVLAFNAASGIVRAPILFSTANTGNSAVFTTTVTIPAGKIFVSAPLTNFGIRSVRDQYTAPGGVVDTGVNMYQWGVTTTIAQSASPGKIDVTTDCFARPELYLPASLETACSAGHEVLFAPTNELQRAVDQPRTTLFSYSAGFPKLSTLPFNVGLAPLNPTLTGVHALCGLGSFAYFARTFPGWSSPNQEFGFKFNKFGFYVTDCDMQVVGYGQQLKFWASGIIAADKYVSPGYASDQSPSINLHLVPPFPIFITQELSQWAGGLALEAGVLK
jgi:hypothetical protein